MNFRDYCFCFLCFLFLFAIYLAYQEIYRLDRLIGKLIKRSQGDMAIIARYEIGIQALPQELRFKVLQRIHRPEPENEPEEYL